MRRRDWHMREERHEVASSDTQDSIEVKTVTCEIHPPADPPSTEEVRPPYSSRLEIAGGTFWRVGL